VVQLFTCDAAGVERLVVFDGFVSNKTHDPLSQPVTRCNDEFGPAHMGKPLGTFGCMATLSFHETKNLTCGEGGRCLSMILASSSARK